MPAKVRDGDHRCTLGLQNEEDTEWEPPENGAANLAKSDRKTGWTFLYSQKRRAKLTEELAPEASPLAVVPRSGVESIELGLWPNFQT